MAIIMFIVLVIFFVWMANGFNVQWIKEWFDDEDHV